MRFNVAIHSFNCGLCLHSLHSAVTSLIVASSKQNFLFAARTCYIITFIVLTSWFFSISEVPNFMHDISMQCICMEVSDSLMFSVAWHLKKHQLWNDGRASSNFRSHLNMLVWILLQQLRMWINLHPSCFQAQAHPAASECCFGPLYMIITTFFGIWNMLLWHWHAFLFSSMWAMRFHCSHVKWPL